jgi:amino acid transporter
MHSLIGSRLTPHRHTALLIAILAMFGVRPLISGTGGGSALYSVIAILLFLLALFTIQVDELLGDRDLLLKQRKKSGALGWILATAAIVSRLGEITTPSHLLALTTSISWLIFIGFVTFTELRGVLKQRSVTRETISMSISVYLLMGLTWALFFIVLFDLQPHAFSFGASPPPSEQLVTPVLLYFSLTTLATVGYGDITPVTLLARYAAVTEGIAGQFYLAILVARLVGMQMSQSTIKAVEKEGQEL